MVKCEVKSLLNGRSITRIFLSHFSEYVCFIRFYIRRRNNAFQLLDLRGRAGGVGENAPSSLHYRRSHPIFRAGKSSKQSEQTNTPWVSKKMREGVGVSKKRRRSVRGWGGKDSFFCPTPSPCSFSHSLAVSICSRAFGNECPLVQPPLSLLLLAVSRPLRRLAPRFIRQVVS